MPDKLMRALVQTSYGPPSHSLTLQSLPKPALVPSSSDLLIRVVAASIAPAESLFLLGRLRVLGVFPLPDRLGIDFSGIVESAGEAAQAEGWKQGEEVLGCLPMCSKGVYQEFIIAPSGICVRKPGNLSWEEAACLPSKAMTALQALRKHEGGREAIFITGGLGGVGHYALQLAHGLLGFKKIYASVSTSKVSQLKSLYPWVDEVIDYKLIDPITVIPKGSLDVVFSTIGTPGPWMPYLARERPVPTLIEITTSPGSAVIQENWGLQLPWHARWLFDATAWWFRPRVPEGVKYLAHNTKIRLEDLKAVVREAAEGRLKPLVAGVFKLEDAVEAFELAQRGVGGKVVIRVAE
ncbi:GroES-like protein [Calocera viscosa TUFC12733]|uniref:GroES-like protein n=1 Tax=Calocera viscosa (strain TUFC12733) TaxID=1330018 RepID=A0A167QND6_CALVF|nr:GroES-like protein [Calocera viscosa TUFC12733]